MLLIDNMAEYLASLSIMVLTITFCCIMFNIIKPGKKLRRTLCTRAHSISTDVWKRVCQLFRFLDLYSKMQSNAEAMFHILLPALDFTTILIIKGTTCVSKHYASHRKFKRKRRRTYRDIWILSAMASTVNDAKSLRTSPVMCRFDTDSFIIGLDTYSSRRVSNQRSHFKNLRPTPSQYGSLKEIGGVAPIKGIGTLNWRVEEDFGATHQLLIPNSLYVPKSPKCLLSPQHLAQVSPRSQRNSTLLEMRHDRGILHWGPEGKFRRTGMINKSSNTPNIFSAPLCHKFQKYCAMANMECSMCETEFVCYPAHIIPDDDSSVSSSEGAPYEAPIITPRPDNEVINMTPDRSHTLSDHQDENMTEFLTRDEFRQVHVIESDEEALSATIPYAELLRWHYRSGHMSFHKLKAMARLGILPRRLANVEIPQCASCYFGKMARKPWRSKTQPRCISPGIRPGQCVSVDQMESSTTGFVKADSPSDVIEWLPYLSTIILICLMFIFTPPLPQKRQ